MTTIRPFRVEDAEALSELYRASVTQLGSRFYGPDQVRAWASLTPSPEAYRERARDGRTVLVAEADAGEPLAYADLEPDGHIDHFYVAPQATGMGLARELLAAIEGRAAEARLERLYVEASEGARRLFTRHGFAVLHRRDLQIEGVPIHNYAMEKRL